MINCDKCRTNLSAFIDDETNEQEASRIKKHLDACPGCQEQFKALKSVRTSLSSLSKISASPSFDVILRDRIRREMHDRSSRFSAALFPRFRVPAFAAAAVAVLVIGMLIGGTLLQTPASQLTQQNQEDALQTLLSERTETNVNADSNTDGEPVRVIYFVNADGQLQQINERQVVTVNYRLSNGQSISRRSRPERDLESSDIRGMVRQANIQTVKF